MTNREDETVDQQLETAIADAFSRRLNAAGPADLRQAIGRLNGTDPLHRRRLARLAAALELRSQQKDVTPPACVGGQSETLFGANP